MCDPNSESGAHFSPAFSFLQSFPLDPCGERYAGINTGPIMDPYWVWILSIDTSWSVKRPYVGRSSCCCTRPSLPAPQGVSPAIPTSWLFLIQWLLVSVWGASISYVYQNQASSERTAKQLFASGTRLLYYMELQWILAELRGDRTLSANMGTYVNNRCSFKKKKSALSNHS